MIFEILGWIRKAFSFFLFFFFSVLGFAGGVWVGPVFSGLLGVCYGWFRVCFGWFAWCWHRGAAFVVRLGVGASGAAWRGRVVAGSGLRVRAVWLVRFGFGLCPWGGGVGLAGVGAVWFHRFAGVRGLRPTGAGFCRQSRASRWFALLGRSRGLAAGPGVVFAGFCALGGVYVSFLVWLSFLSCLVLQSSLSTGAVVAVRRLVVSVAAAAFAPRCAAGVFVAVLAFAGSRALPASGSGLVVRVASDLAAGGASFVVGCCSGVDAALLSAVPGSVPPSLVRCLAAFGSDGVGTGPASAVVQVTNFARSGGSVQWWAGGAASLPLRARLANRTRAVVGLASAGLVVFFSSPGSRGSLLACRCALSRGLPVVAFPVGFSAENLPVLGAGFWLPSGSFGGFKWVENQAKIFT